jgi:Major capsid protein Gp23
VSTATIALRLSARQHFPPTPRVNCSDERRQLKRSRIVRLIFPRFIANDLVSVQPMSQPTGKIFYFETLYSPAQVGSPLAYNRVDIPANFTTTRLRRQVMRPLLKLRKSRNSACRSKKCTSRRKPRS